MYNRSIAKLETKRLVGEAIADEQADLLDFIAEMEIELTNQFDEQPTGLNSDMSPFDWDEPPSMALSYRFRQLETAGLI